MDKELVTNSESVKQESEVGGGGEDCPSPTSFRYTEQFEKACPFYMSIGMSYDDFWNGDVCMVKAYRKAEEYRMKQKNYDDWQMGLYIYSVMCRVAPLYHPFNKKPEPVPYLDEPFPMSDEEAEEQKMRAERRKHEDIARRVKLFAEQFNKRFEENTEGKGEEDSAD